MRGCLNSSGIIILYAIMSYSTFCMPFANLCMSSTAFGKAFSVLFYFISYANPAISRNYDGAGRDAEWSTIY